MDATSVVAGWKARLTALAVDPGYRYRDTSQALIDKEYRASTTFIGFTEGEVGALEVRLGGMFSAVFREYLLHMAASPGLLFTGSDLVGVDDVDRFRRDAVELMAETDPRLALPPDAMVYLAHQGYMFEYVRACGGFDSPPMAYTEGAREPCQTARSFADLVDQHLRLAEENAARDRSSGRRTRTLLADGWTIDAF